MSILEAVVLGSVIWAAYTACCLHYLIHNTKYLKQRLDTLEHVARVSAAEPLR